MPAKKTAATGSKIARASAARLAAVQAVYQIDLNEQKAGDVIAEFKLHRLGKAVDDDEMVLPDGNLFDDIVRGLDARRPDAEMLVDKALERRAKDGKAPGVEPLIRCILQCGAYELMAHGTIDAPIIISDYVNVGHAFYEGKEPGLINAVLDAIAKVIRE